MAKTYIITVNGKQYKKTIEDKNLEKYSEYSPVLYSEPEEDTETSKSPAAPKTPKIPTTITNPIESTPVGKSTNLATGAPKGSTTPAPNTESTSDDGFSEQPTYTISGESITKNKFNELLEDEEFVNKIKAGKADVKVTNDEEALNKLLGLDPEGKEPEVGSVDYFDNQLKQAVSNLENTDYEYLLDDINTQIEQREKDGFTSTIDSFDSTMEDYEKQLKSFDLQIETLVEVPVEGDESILTKIKEIVDGEYTTQNQLNIANKQIEILEKQYKDSQDVNLENANKLLEDLKEKRKDVFENYELDLANFNKSTQAEVDAYNLKGEELVNAYNTNLKQYKELSREYYQALDDYERSLKRYQDTDEAYFLAYDVSVEEITLSSYTGRAPLQWEKDEDGRRLYFDPRTEQYEKEVGYDYDRSLGIRFESDSWGKMLDEVAYGTVNVATALPTLKDAETRQKTLEYMKSRLNNVPENLMAALYSAAAVWVEFYNTEPNYMHGHVPKVSKEIQKKREEEAKKSEDFIIKMYENLGKMDIDGEGVETALGTLKRQDVGKGIVGGGTGADVIAGGFGAITSMFETLIPAALTYGASLPIQVAAPMYTEYNIAKAKNLYGDDEKFYNEDGSFNETMAINELVKSGQTEVQIPLALGLGATVLEYIGFKGVMKYMKYKPLKNGTIVKLAAVGNKEGLTEVGQLGFEKLNSSLGEGMSLKEASKVAINAMTGQEGLEMYLNGFIGSTTISVGGRALNRALRSDNSSIQEALDKIDNLYKLNNLKYNTRNQDVKNALDLDIKEAEQDLINFIKKSRALSKFLTKEQKVSLTDIIKEKDSISNKKEKLKTQLDQGGISKKEYGYAIRSLNNQDKRLSDQIIDIKNQALEIAAAGQLEIIQSQMEEYKMEGEASAMTADEIKDYTSDMDVDSEQAANEYGLFIDNGDGTFKIIINKDKPRVGTAAHEFAHAIIFKAIGKDLNIIEELSDALTEHVNTIVTDGGKVNKRMGAYGKVVENEDGTKTFVKDEDFAEETITIISESIVDGSLKYNEGFFVKIGDIIRRFLQNNLGKYSQDIKLDEGRDVWNFLKDFAYSVKNNKPSKAIKRFIKEGAKGKLIEKAKKKKKKERKEDKRERFSKSEIDKINKRSSKDIKADNKDIYNQIMQNAEDFNISPKKAAETYLDELIENNLGLAENEAQKAYNNAPKELELKKRIPLDMFRSAFREELTTIAKTWDPAKNDSFGIYAANLLNKRYGQILNAQIDKLEQEVGTTSLFVQTEEGAQERKIAAEKDTRREKFEEEDLSPSAQLAKKKRDRKKSDRDIKGELIENRLEFNKAIKDKLKKVQTSTNYDIKNKSYKDVKKDINKIAKPVNTRKQIKETETSSLYSYMEVIAEHFGVKPTSIIAAAQNLSKQESANARLKIAEGMKKLGPKNYLKSMLGPFNFAADAKSIEKGVAIGLSPTILKAFYIKGKRGDAKLNITGWAFNENLTDAEILEAVGLNEDFTLKDQKRAGTFDGVVKGIITQTAVVAANQGVRLQTIENIKEAHDVGTAEAIEDIQADLNKISAGKPSIMFSKASSITQDVINDTMADFLDNTTVDLSNTVKVKNAYKEFLEDNYPEQADILTKEEYSYIAKKITSSVKEYIKLQNKYKIAFKNEKVSDVILVDNQILPYTKKDFILTSLSPEAFLDKKVFKLLSPLFKDPNVSSTSLMTSKQRANTGRQMVREVIEDMLNTGMTPKEILSFILKYGEGMYASSAKILDGRFIDDGKGGLINDPKWEDWINNTGESITRGSITYKIGDKVPGNKWRTYSAISKAVKDGLAKKGDLIIENNKRVPETNRGQVFSNLQDLINFISSIEKLDIKKDGKILTRSEIIDKYNIDTTKFKEESDAALNDQDFKGREKQSNENANFVERLSKLYIKKIKDENDSLQYEDLYVLSRMFGSNMKSPMKRAANLRYIAEGAINVPAKQRGQLLQYEHMEPTQYKILQLFNELINNGKLREDFWDTYNVAIIPKTMDNVLIKEGLQNLMMFDHKPGKPPWLRYFNMRTFGNKGIVTIKDIFTKEVIGKGFVKANNMVLKGDLSKQDLQEIAKIRRIQKDQIRFSKTGGGMGASIFDFDDTLARTKSGVRGTVPNQDNKPKPKRKVIFLAGGAGSGKSNVVKKLGLEKQGFKIVNQDISLEWLKKNHGLPTDMRDLNKEQRSTLGKLGHQARGIAKRKMMKFQGQGDGIIVDGTGASLKQMQKLVDEFEAKGYDVSMIFVGTSLDVALARNKARKERSLLDIIVRKNHESVMNNKEAFKGIFGDTFMEVNTDNIGLDSPMPDKLIKQVNKFTTSYEKFRLDATEFAEQGASILAAGGKFDFSEFEKVNEGEPGPFLQKAIERAKKFGTDDVFVLTARPAESAKHIQEFLKSQGLDLPIGNIVGLGDSTGKAKANWVLGKLEEGYNDIYFVDDAFENVKAVRDALNKTDVKSDVVQAKIKFSKTGSDDFNTMLNRNKGIPIDKIFSDAEVKAMRKRGIGKFDYFIPPSAEDFKGLIYYFLGKGKQGDADLAWFKKHLLLPFARGIRAWNTYKQKMSDEYSELTKKFPKVRKLLRNKVPGTNLTVDHAVRVYLWHSNGIEIPGISAKELDALIDYVENNDGLLGFANALSMITRLPQGYTTPNENWALGNIATDLRSVVTEIGRKEFLSEWIDNKNIIFTKENLNKIEAIYGVWFREALENILYRMENGTNRTVGQDRNVNRLLDWISGAVGAIMFVNMRSALLQTISLVNFVNWADNNIFKAAAAFANQPQFWKDFVELMNSPMLKQRRAGLQIDIQYNELTKAFAERGGSAQGVLNYLLELGFTPTRIMDSFAIAFGGASFYRNRIKTYIKQGMTEKQAKEKAFLDFQEIAEETQQSSREDLISQQQASVLGRIILPFQNVTMQMTRLMKKGLSDIKYGRGDFKTNVSKVIYYGVVQNIIFGALQSALAFIMWGDDEEEIKKKELRVLNGALDTILRGTGIYGALASTIKNTLRQWNVQRKKPYGQTDWSAVTQEIVNISPPMGSKLRLIRNAIKTTEYNKGVSEKLRFRIENPTYRSIANVIEATTNFPIARTLNKANNLEEAITGNHDIWQRVAMVAGWSRWDVGAKDEELEAAKAEVKAERKAEKDTKRKEKKEQEKIEKQKEKAAKEKVEKEAKEKAGIKTVRCSGVRSNGERCKLTTETNAKTWKCMHHMEFKDGSDRDGDGIKEYRCTATTSSGKRCNNKTENKNKKCYAHQ